MAMTERETCEWVQDLDGVWNTDCLHAFEVTTGTPVENEFKYCPFCGKVILECAYDEASLSRF